MNTTLVRLNDTAVFKLTTEGRVVLEDYFYAIASSARKPVPMTSILPTPDPLGFYRMPLWEFAAIFGPRLHLGSLAFVERNQIQIEADPVFGQSP